MKLFIWQGNGVSGAYHDDGTVVVLAETAEEARGIVQGAMLAQRRIEDEWRLSVRRWKEERGIPSPGNIPPEHMPAWKEFVDANPWKVFDTSNVPDGEITAFDRDPDEEMDVDVPRIVAFNGGGYD